MNAQVHALTARLLKRPHRGVTDLIPGYANLYVEYDASQTSEGAVRRWLKPHLRVSADAPSRSRRVEIAVVYDGEDLHDIAAKAGLTVADVVQLHSGRAYHVYAQGFTPGFPFMADVDERIRLPRRDRPRDQVPVHSVAITGRQAGIYPLPSPGGWNLLGRTLERVYDPHREPPFLVAPGDEVRFVSAEGPIPTAPEVLELLPRGVDLPLPVLEVIEPGLLDLLVDRGRLFAGRFGLARSGPLDARSAACANSLLANRAGAPSVEINLKGGRYRALGDVKAAFAGYGLEPLRNNEPLPGFTVFALRSGDELAFRQTAGGCRGYLALAGGIVSKSFLGSASVDVRGRIGRPLAAGDVLGVTESRSARDGYGYRPRVPLADPAVVRIIPGPQIDAEALHQLSSATFEVRSADRMGIRLSGPRVPGGEVLSEAAPIGAIQVPAGGEPIILLNDRGTLGGYKKPALVLPSDLPKLGQIRSGQGIRFKPAWG